MEKDDTIPADKIDPLDPKLFYTFERKYTITIDMTIFQFNKE